jgi:DNA-directed RNA polymerase specialized sigma24 family protein
MSLDKINDYELIYLYRENVSKALETLTLKYSKTIKYMMYEKDIKVDKDDVEQNCYIILYNCVKLYDMDSPVSFYRYFMVCLRRYLTHERIKSYKILNTESYIEQIHHKNDYYNASFLEEADIIYHSMNCMKKLDQDIINEIFIEGMDENVFAKKHNLSVKQVYNYTYQLRIKLKKKILEKNI